MKIAIISPNQNAYSESFIQMHKKIFEEYAFYYDGEIPRCLEGKADFGIFKTDSIKVILRKIFRLHILDLFTSSISINELLFRNSLRKQSVDCVLAEYGPTSVAVLKTCKALKLPLFVYFHGYDVSRYDILAAYGDMYKEIFKYASKLFVVSRAMQKQLINLGANVDNIIINPCPASNQFFSLNPQYKNSSIISVGRFVDKKAPYYTILSFNEVLKKKPKAKLIMVGDGPLRQCCINLAKALGISDSVEFKNIVDHSIITKLFEEAYLYTQHSLVSLDGDSEGTPVAIQEALAAKLPVVSTKHCGISDIINHGYNGFLVDEHDYLKASEFIISLLSDTDLAQRMGINGREFLMNNQNEETHLECLRFNIYKTVKK